MSKKINKETYEDYINNGDEHGLSGYRLYSDNSPIETIGSIGDIKRSQGIQAQESELRPYTQNISDIYGQTDYGNSIYDKDITSASQLNDIEDTRANLQPFSHKLGIGLVDFAGKTLTATAGGIGTLLYGVPAAIFNGKFSSIYDNDFAHILENANESLDNALTVHLSDRERNGSL